MFGDPIKQISSHERKLFSSGLQQKIEEDSIYGWNAEIDAIKALKAKNAYNSYKKISAANCSVSASIDRKVNDENSDVPIEVNTRMMRERVTSSYSATTCISGGSLSSKSKPPHNPNRGEKKDVGNWREYKKHLPQLSVGINHSRNNEVTSINKVDGPNVSHYKPLSKGSNLNGQLSSKIVNAKFEKANKLWQGNASNQIRDSVNGTDTKVVTVKAKSVILEQATIEREKNAVKSVATDFVNGNEAKIVSDKGTGLDQITLRERLGAMYEKVHIVDNLSAAKEVVSKLTSQYKHLVHACDTEACIC